ncbi:Uncharacterised protein [Legionella beliardensis]|uniref:Uncharacterized protein n=2 Tax=Legionella beliardensis TaxID=91822 RepID=A0A378HZW7_9GAMM|nr:Uncharacterised protein [Legionella beliardensis]
MEIDMDNMDFLNNIMISTKNKDKIKLKLKFTCSEDLKNKLKLDIIEEKDGVTVHISKQDNS